MPGWTKWHVTKPRVPGSDFLFLATYEPTKWYFLKVKYIHLANE